MDPRPLVLDRLSLFSRSVFEEIFGDPWSIAVVGNGPVEPEMLNIINSAEVVVRFNNWNTRTQCLTTTLPNSGRRGDLVFSHLDCQPSLVLPWDRPKLMVMAIPAPFQIDRNPFYLEERYQKIPVSMVNPYLNRLLCLELGFDSGGWSHPLPTVGMTFLYHFWRFNTNAVVHVCGFDWHFDVHRGTYDGVSVDSPRANPNNHSYLREARWVQKNLLNHPRWIFSARSERALRTLESIPSLSWETSVRSWPNVGPW